MGLLIGSKSVDVSRRRLLASAAAGVGALALGRDALAAPGGELLYVDFTKGVARRGRQDTALDTVVGGSLRFAKNDGVTALPAGLLCESVQSGASIKAAADIGAIGWQPHPATPALTATVERTGPHSASVRFKGDKPGLQILVLNKEAGLDVAAGGSVRFGAVLRSVEGSLPKQLSWALLSGAKREGANILHSIVAYADQHGFIDRHFVRSQSPVADVRLGLGFVATEAFDFTLNIAGPQLSVDENFRFLSAVLSDRNSLKDTAAYFESPIRQFEISGLGPLVGGGVVYSETGARPSDHLVVGIDSQFRAALTLARDGERVLNLPLGDTVPLQPWKIRCEIDARSGAVTADWCGRIARATASRMPDLTTANLGFHENTCAETFITSVKLTSVGDFRVLPASNVASPLLFDDFEKREGLQFGMSPTGHRWAKSRPLDISDFAIVRGDYVAVQPLGKPVATYLKADFTTAPASMGALISFSGEGDEAAVALISSTLGFPQIGTGGSNAVHNVFASNRAYYGLAVNGSLLQLGPSPDYPEPIDPKGKRYGIGWSLEGDVMTLLLPGGYFHRLIDPRWTKANNREVIYELYRATNLGLVPVIHAVSAS